MNEHARRLEQIDVKAEIEAWSPRRPPQSAVWWALYDALDEGTRRGVLRGLWPEELVESAGTASGWAWVRRRWVTGWRKSELWYDGLAALKRVARQALEVSDG